MASSNNNSNSSKRGGGDEELKEMTEISKTLKEGERIVAPSRRPDGTLRKPIRIRAGYVPQDEVAIYQSKGALWRKEMQSQEVPPGYDTDPHTKPKTKSVKRNERKKEKRHQQAALEKGKNTEAIEDGNMVKGALPDEDLGHASDSVKSLTSQMNELAVSSNPAVVGPSSDLADASNMESPVQDIDKRIRALKKKQTMEDNTRIVDIKKSQ
ncbi:partner of Y14 and mago isoform X3 [Populus trichocarpa]|uniref:partner of Y14 and mago isoform X3 n=1 Tax=Populus trichocarpa TaxID=3694 RepID=UPI000CCD8B57|nr:partner of Y14 and mago isoform X3 [Populus trichocarpa]|eukprot:XP_024449634.1 partner of Y14 and mago isoform X3 [Populus trichocarpa]